VAKTSPPNIPHRVEQVVHEGCSPVSFTRESCLAIWASLRCKRTKIDNPEPAVIYESMEPLNRTHMLIEAIRRRAKYTSHNNREGLSEKERLKIHESISKHANRLFDLLDHLDRDVLHDWCSAGSFLKTIVANDGEFTTTPDYEREKYLYELVGQLARAAKACESKTVEELSDNTGSQRVHVGVDIALDEITKAYIKITPAKLTTGSPETPSPFEQFAKQCLEKMGFRGVSEDSLRHMIRKSSA
jgi:hypothetical protein